MLNTTHYALRSLSALALAASMSGATPALAQGRPPAQSGTIAISAHAAALGVGYEWGNGLLRYRGHSYHFTVNGISVADLGIANISARGRVYNLHRVQDFSGTYAALGGEATAGKGIGGQILRNANGVEVRIDESARGARLDASADGIQLTLR